MEKTAMVNAYNDAARKIDSLSVQERIKLARTTGDSLEQGILAISQGSSFKDRRSIQLELIQNPRLDWNAELILARCNAEVVIELMDKRKLGDLALAHAEETITSELGERGRYAMRSRDMETLRHMLRPANTSL